jgi:adenylate kinase
MEGAKYLTLMGPIASGKGTQAGIIARKYGLAHLSPGAIFRDAIAAGTEVGLKVKNIVESGYLVPDSMVNDVVGDVLGTHDFSRGFILDGYPRTMGQAAALDEMLAAYGARLSKAIALDISEAEAVRRLSGRFFCAKCGQTYNDEFSPPKVPGVCDICGGTEFLRRADDQPAAIRNRLAVYREESAPILGFYRERGLLVEINVTKIQRDEVSAMIDRAIA